MPKLYVKDAGSWKQVLRIWVKQSGTWKSPTAGLVTSSGVSKQFYPDSTGTTVYTTAGTYSYVIPAGVTSITVPKIVGGGGGGSGSSSFGDNFQGGSGGSGGYLLNQTVAVTPGETLTVICGAGGLKGSSYFNGSQICVGSTSSITGTSGEASQIKRGATVLVNAGGGGNGGGGPYGSAGAAGSPNGVAGTAGTGFNDFAQNQGGDNGQGYGKGGANNGGNFAYGCPGLGGTGYVSITPVNANRQNSTTSGSYSFVVPAGITSLTASVYGAGGGAGSIYFCGDGWVGGGGSSGGYYTNQTIAVTPGETLTVVCGAGGAGGSVGGACQAGQNGTAGGSSYIARGGTNLVIATGGGGGGVGLGSNGAAGSPNGVQGEQPCNPGNCGYGFTGNRAGGQNGTGYGNGATAVFAFGTQASGSSGALFLSW